MELYQNASMHARHLSMVRPTPSPSTPKPPSYPPPNLLTVSRPLFIEEHGLRALLDQSGVGVELARTAYEDGDWAAAVSEALAKGASRKARKRRETHFARAADDSAMTSSMAWVAFIRGMAMIGWRSQQVVDICIPVLLDKDKPVEEANITVILVQLKVREHATSRSKVAVWEDKIKCFPLPNSSRDAFAGPTASENMDAEKAYRTRPYISLVMELGLVVSSNSAAIPSKVVDFLDQCGGYNPPPTSQKKHQVHLSVSNVHVTLPPARRKIRTSSDPIHPRYSLFYHGCSHKVYRCIPDTTAARDVCRTLLQIPTVFNDRPSNRPIEPVLQMKPFWNSGSNCFTWINEPYLKPKSQQNEPEDEEVLIGTANSDVDMEDDSALNYAMDQDQ